MKNCAVFVILALMVIGSDALPFGKRMIYYQQPAAAQYYAAPQPQRMMYMHYMQPGYGNARSMQAASALVAGQHVATGTYLEDCIPVEGDTAAGDATSSQVQHGEDVLGDAGVHSAHSVAEAYPDDSDAAAPAPPPPPPPSRSQTVEDEQTPAVVDVPVEDETQTPIESDDEAKVPRVYNFEKNEPAAEAELPAPAPIAPAASSAFAPPARRYLPSKKKVYVELDEAAAVEEPDTENAVATVEDEENNEEDEETDVAQVVPVVPQKPRRPAAKKPVKPVKPVKAAADCSGCAKANADCDSPCARAGAAGSSKPTSKPQLPAGTFFPISFGGTTGGAIAIANSFSTGEGGSATSHAIAYGSPDSVRARVKPSKLH